MDRRSRVRDIVARALRDAGDDGAFDDGEALVTGGRLASLDVVAILVELESAFGFTADPDRFDPADFDSVDRIVAMLEAAA